MPQPLSLPRITQPTPELPEPEGLSEAQLAELDRFMACATYGDGLSCVEADRRAGLGGGY